MNTTRIQAQKATPLALPTLNATLLEQGVADIASLADWYEADQMVYQNGPRLRSRISSRYAEVLNLVPPLQVTGSHGQKALRMGYGKADYAGTERGAMRPDSGHNLLSTTGFTVLTVQRVPTVASGESATLGGYVWSSRGPSGNATPGLNISGSTGRPTFRAGGAVITNPGGFDARDGQWHITRCVWDFGASQLRLNIDRGRASGTANGAATPPDASIPHMLAPLIGGFLQADDANTFGTPFYGDWAAMLPFTSVLTAGELAAAENYLAAKYGITLV
jgi:hypothetical protein